MDRKKHAIRIGGASGYWGDAPMAVPQLLAGGRLDFLVFDYLAEITMGILARMRSADPALGFATDFVTQAMAPNLAEISRQGVKVVSNAGGVNPNACAEALRALIAKQGLSLKVATVSGDDLLTKVDDLASIGHRDMFSGAGFPENEKISSINAYLGAFPIAAALDRGAEIVITGRCVDSAVTLGACIHAFGWQADNFDLLAAGSLAGHILECGTQATGGNFTDWHLVADRMEHVGYPIAEISSDGGFIVSKPTDSAGLVSVGTVSEQMLYEIGDPQAYILPDVTCDFSEVKISQVSEAEVLVTGTKGRPPTPYFKTCLTWQDGYRGGHLFGFYGIDAELKAQAFADAAIRRASASLRGRNMADFTEISVEVLGAESQFGAMRQVGVAREVNAKIAVKHEDAKGVALLLKEATGLALSGPPGLSGFAGARPKPTPVMTLFSFLLAKDSVTITIADDVGSTEFVPTETGQNAAPTIRPIEPPKMTSDGIKVPLIQLAFARSGDKGDAANIGVIARKPEYLPYIWHALNDDLISETYGHFLKGKISRYLLPGSHSMNIVLEQVLAGGGSASLRNDPQAKGYAQLLLVRSVVVPTHLMEP